MKTLAILLVLSLVSLNSMAKTNPNDSLNVNESMNIEKNISYKIQIGAFYSHNIDTVFLNSLCCNLFVEENNSNKKFLIGNYTSFEQAKYALDVVRKKIVSDAFIVPYINENRTDFKNLRK